MDRDEDALSWDGDVRDPTHVDGARVAGPRGSTDPSEPGDRARDASPAEIDENADAQAPSTSAGSVLLVVYAAIGGAYLLFTIGWVLAVARAGVTLPNPFFDVMYQIGAGLAVAAPVTWFGLTFLLTHGDRGRRGRRVAASRLLWLVIGLLLVAPWPFIVGGAV